MAAGPRLWVEMFAASSASDLREFYLGSENLAGPSAGKILSTARIQPRPEDLAKTLQERDRLRDELLALMESSPLIVAPVGATTAFPHHASRVSIDGESISVFRAFSYAQTFNVFDLPSVVVRAGSTAAGLPVGVQIVGRPFEEERVLNAATIIEAAHSANSSRPSFPAFDPI